MYYADYHIHTSFSSDSDAKIEEMIEQAIHHGLKEIAITDHIDFDYPDPNYPFLFDYELYSEKIEQMRQCYGNKLRIKKGIEIGLQPHLENEYQELLEKNEYDFIIGSTHCVNGLELYGDSFYVGKTQKQAYQSYFEDVLHSITHSDFFQVYGHIDYVNRYGNYENRSLNPMDYREIIEEILKELVKKQIGLEINTSGFRYGLGYTHPQLSILKRYHELGGEIITVGSDAHKPSDIASYFKEAYTLLKEAGFSAITVFENKKPRFIPIT